ncbi:MAG: hypothetical protein JRN06_03115 [Nitrososphaerota archaeon]|nr:hypothetical protein [Nitrososphaerota archaeon]MDG7023151.1 hypothetical protein [Nitrososphaerota archaeon]
MKNGLKALYGSKAGKILPVLIIAGLVASASASVFVVYYGNATATVKTPDVQLIAGGDASSSSSYKPTVSVSNTSDYASIGITLFPSAFKANPIVAPQPGIYYTDLLEVKNTGATTHDVNSIAVTNVVDSSSSLGEIDVYYCPTQTNAPTTTSCELYKILTAGASPATGSVTFPVTLGTSSPTNTNYIEIVAHAKAGATVSSTVAFDLQISWV